jgi:hypothetical protein
VSWDETRLAFTSPNVSHSSGIAVPYGPLIATLHQIQHPGVMLFNAVRHWHYAKGGMSKSMKLRASKPQATPSAIPPGWHLQPTLSTRACRRVAHTDSHSHQ